ncbi:MAG TPA: two-component regulator propeller domain-containing protein, partial [Saprospiraceae bacterium]|nr:two-component regulator propeller domain-containing protein [Saprospiraceae bacterium]
MNRIEGPGPGRIIRLLAWLCMSPLTMAYAQQLLLPFEHFTEADGLPAPVREIIQDANGFMWLGTTDGLVRYDGRNFKVFRNKLGDTSSLPNNIINDLWVDALNRVWIATNGGLCYFSYERDGFQNIQLPQDLEKTDRYRVHCVRSDPFGQIWFASKTGIHRLDERWKIRESYYLPFDLHLIIKS